VAEARARFGDLLDQAEQGATVIIERKGMRFTLEAQQRKPQGEPPDRFFEFVDPAVMSGNWTWTAGSRGLRFRPRRGRR